jgi:hypothetical protein
MEPSEDVGTALVSDTFWTVPRSWGSLAGTWPALVVVAFVDSWAARMREGRTRAGARVRSVRVNIVVVGGLAGGLLEVEVWVLQQLGACAKYRVLAARAHNQPLRACLKTRA